MINRRKDRPVYRQVADALRAQIRNGTVQPGQRLNGEARIAHEHGVGRDSVRAALALLRAEGLIETHVPYGSVVRAEMERAEFSLQRSSRIVLRMPTPDEREELDIPEGVPVAEITHGARTRLVPGSGWVFVVK